MRIFSQENALVCTTYWMLRALHVLLMNNSKMSCLVFWARWPSNDAWGYLQKTGRYVRKTKTGLWKRQFLCSKASLFVSLTTPHKRAYDMEVLFGPLVIATPSSALRCSVYLLSVLYCAILWFYGNENVHCANPLVKMWLYIFSIRVRKSPFRWMHIYIQITLRREDGIMLFAEGGRWEYSIWNFCILISLSRRSPGTNANDVEVTTLSARARRSRLM